MNARMAKEKLYGAEGEGRINTAKSVGLFWCTARTTIVEQPTESDWFPIDLDSITPYLQFTAQTTTKGTSFEGNFVYLRVKVDRSYLGAGSYDSALHGALNKVVVLI